MSSADGISVLFQGAGVLVSRKAHGAHHRAPFEGNYCIVSGFWNPILDAGGSPDGFFRRLERFVAARTGVEPRCWYEPDCIEKHGHTGCRYTMAWCKTSNNSPSGAVGFDIFLSSSQC